MPEETTPDSSDGLLATSEATPTRVPNTPVVLTDQAPQYSSRRELRAATERQGQRQGAPRTARVEKSTVGNANVDAVTTAVKLSRSDRAYARRLNAAEPKPKNRADTPAAFTKKKSKQNPVVVLFTLLLVPGFIASASLPAYAFAPAGSEHQAELAEHVDELASSEVPAQKLAVDSSVSAAAIQRDPITATSVAELQAQEVAAAALAAYNASKLTAASSKSSANYRGVSGTVSGARVAGDDYPWPGASNTLSPLSYYYRQCVDFVAFRLNRDAGVAKAPWKYVWSNLTPSGGDASQWRAAWVKHGWTTSGTPVVGAVAWFNGNHVAYVKDIVGGNVIIEEYNGMVKRGYAIRTIPTSSVPTFLYPPPR